MPVRQLVVVALSADGTRMLLGQAADSRPSHELVLDERVARAVRGQPLDDNTPVKTSALSPKQIQARLRAGASVDEVAKEAGVPLSRVERYAGPVLSERENVLDTIRAATLTRARVGRSGKPVGESVVANLATTAFARPETAEWSAYRRADGEWVARLEVVVRGRGRHAEWLQDAVSGDAVALDAYAAALGFTAAPAPPAAAAPKAGEAVTAEQVAARAKAATSRAPRPAAPKPAAAKPAASRPAAAKSTAAKKSPAKKAVSAVPAVSATKTPGRPAKRAAKAAGDPPAARRGRPAS